MGQKEGGRGRGVVYRVSPRTNADTRCAFLASAIGAPGFTCDTVPFYCWHCPSRCLGLQAQPSSAANAPIVATTGTTIHLTSLQHRKGRFVKRKVCRMSEPARPAYPAAVVSPCLSERRVRAVPQAATSQAWFPCVSRARDVAREHTRAHPRGSTNICATAMACVHDAVA